ncbi:MAG: hypothetical protein GX237_11350 [Clostridiales bacterium]|nr:hypothetical protein [Clostridiales bacterium]
MESWEEINKNTIPVGKYCAFVNNGEESGLIIRLESNEFFVNINFGVVSAFRMLDEGIILGELFDEDEIIKYKSDNFSNIIYKVQNGEFGDFIKKMCTELYDYLDLKHFVIITMNYIVEVISMWEPTIEVIKK